MGHHFQSTHTIPQWDSWRNPCIVYFLVTESSTLWSAIAILPRYLWTFLYLYTFCPLSPISWLRILERCGRWWWPVVRASGQQAHISAVTSRIVGWQLSVIVTGRKCGKASRLSALSTYQPSTSCSLSHATPATSVPGLTWNANSQFKCPKLPRKLVRF